ncbi:hypothetical protein ACFDAU_04130 [Sulfuriferula sp. GW1]|uniref:hypothetical protein n=1 Tax=Sulfuriferula sp. GW1 TaxID=3345111 RepID=UPI0039AE9D2B
MNRKQRRETSRETGRDTLPAYFLLYCKPTQTYLASIDPEIQKLSFSEEAFAAQILTEKDAKELAVGIWEVSGLLLTIQPRYLPHAH